MEEQTQGKKSGWIANLTYQAWRELGVDSYAPPGVDEQECDVCGGWTGFSWIRVSWEGVADRVCGNCLDAGTQGASERASEHAKELRAEADRVDELAQRLLSIPNEQWATCSEALAYDFEADKNIKEYQSKRDECLRQVEAIWYGFEPEAERLRKLG